MASDNNVGGRICRACLAPDECEQPMVYLYENGNNMPAMSGLADMYTQCTTLPLHQYDRLSKYLCHNCHHKLRSLHEFRLMCIDSYNYLNELHTQNTFISNNATESQCNNEHFTDPTETSGIPQELVYFEADEVDAKFLAANECQMDEVYLENSDDNREIKDECDTVNSNSIQCDNINSYTHGNDDKIDGKPFVCDICHKGFTRKYCLEMHMRQHAGSQWECDKCDKSFVKWATYLAHNNSHHNNIDEHIQFQCEYDGCNKSFSIKSSLTIHMKKMHKEHALQREQMHKFICEHCGKSFKSNSALTKHVYTHLPNLMPFKCKICPKKYPTKHKLKEHIMRHEGIKNYVCTLCGLRKTTGHELKVHMNYHTKDKQFPCDFCPRIFSNIGNRSRHVKIVHCGVKEYKCTHCEKSFGKAETLKHHVMTHTGEKPLSCHLCEKRFIQPIALKTHMKTHNKTRR